MPISLVITLKNEVQSVRGFMDSILNQTRMPDEIMIVDGGSEDGTWEILNQEYAPRLPQLRLIQQPCNVAAGRNIGIKESKYPIIAVTDAGCRLTPDWLENIDKAFAADNTIDVIGGRALAEDKTSFQKVVNAYFTVTPEMMDKNPLLISSRNIAFKKAIWEKAGGYPEWLSFTGEDTLFNKHLQSAGTRFKMVPEAIVYWEGITSWNQLYRKAYTYSRGNGQAGLYRETITKTGLIYLLVLFILSAIIFNIWFGLVAVALLILYLGYSGIKLAFKLKDIKILPLAMAAKLVIDLANLWGYWTGFKLAHNKSK